MKFSRLTSQKAVIVGLMFLAVASAGRLAKKRDISEYAAAGWSKGSDGYTYDVPEEPYYEAPSAGCPNGGSGSYCCVRKFYFYSLQFY